MGRIPKNVKKRSKERIWVYGGRDGKQVFQQMICISVKRRNGALNGDCGNVSSNDCRLNFDLSVVETDGQRGLSRTRFSKCSRPFSLKGPSSIKRGQAVFNGDSI